MKNLIAICSKNIFKSNKFANNKYIHSNQITKINLITPQNFSFGISKKNTYL